MSYQPKTQLNNSSVEEFLKSVASGKKLEDCFKIVEIMQKLTKKEPKMWGKSIIGFGQYRYVYTNKTEANWLALGFSPRKQNITLYIMSGFGDHTDKSNTYDDIMQNLGKYKTGKSCLYIKSLDDINLDYLEKLILKSLDYLKAKYKTDLE